ncbi:rCG50168, partial [Rattus norvegicus]
MNRPQMPLVVTVYRNLPGRWVESRRGENWLCWGQKSCPCPSPVTVLERGDPAPHLESTIELALV